MFKVVSWVILSFKKKGENERKREKYISNKKTTFHLQFCIINAKLQYVAAEEKQS